MNHFTHIPEAAFESFAKLVSITSKCPPKFEEFVCSLLFKDWCKNTLQEVFIFGVHV